MEPEVLNACVAQSRHESVLNRVFDSKHDCKPLRRLCENSNDAEKRWARSRARRSALPHRVRIPMMPKGVEHSAPIARRFAAEEVRIPLMPKTRGGSVTVI